MYTFIISILKVIYILYYQSVNANINNDNSYKFKYKKIGIVGTSLLYSISIEWVTHNMDYGCSKFELNNNIVVYERPLGIFRIFLVILMLKKSILLLILQ